MFQGVQIRSSRRSKLHAVIDCLFLLLPWTDFVSSVSIFFCEFAHNKRKRPLARYIFILVAEKDSVSDLLHVPTWDIANVCSGTRLRPGSYVAFLPCRMQLRQKIMRWFALLSFVWITFHTAEMRRMRRFYWRKRSIWPLQH